MPFPAGHRLGPYEIVAPIGAGGMGEVYKARDTRLGRMVAIKVSAERFNSRFESEARAISALNHPHICTLHDIGENYLVMELVDGEALSARLRKGPLPMDLVLRYGAQIADALAAAHKQGIVHRDLKPHNIMVMKSGIKVLDFGLAKNALADETVTASHIAVGTPAYMSPEQREGKLCDTRTDIYALGLVLYEMATGKRASGAVQPELMDSLPRQFAHVVKRCLENDPEDRWQAAKDIKTELEWAGTSTAAQAPQHTSRTTLIWAGAAVTCAALAALGIYTIGFSRPGTSGAAGAPQPLARFTIDLAPREQFPIDGAQPGLLAVAPDGRVFFAARRDGNLRLYSRGLDELAASPVPGTEGAMLPFLSPDGKWIGFAAARELKKVPISGGPVETICPAVNAVGANWGSDGMIVFAPNWNSGLFKVSAQGGVPQPVTTRNAADGEISHDEPFILFDGRGVLFKAVGKQGARIEVVIPATGERRVLTNGGSPVYLPTGHLLWNRAQTLLAAPFDLAKLELAGPPVVVLEGVRGRISRSEPMGHLPTFRRRTMCESWCGLTARATLTPSPKSGAL